MQGDEGTIEEMCSAFPIFYPRTPDRRNLDVCGSFPYVAGLDASTNTFVPFTQKYLPLVNHTYTYNLTSIIMIIIMIVTAIWYSVRRLNPEADSLFQQGRFTESFNAIDWTSDAVQDLERTILTGLIGTYCSNTATEVLILTSYKGYSHMIIMWREGEYWVIEGQLVLALSQPRLRPIPSFSMLPAFQRATLKSWEWAWGKAGSQLLTP